MKKIFTIAAIAAATAFAVSCAKEDENGLQKKGITAHAKLQPIEATKAAGQYSYNIVWETDDRIAVLDNAQIKTSFTLTEGAGTISGTFQQDGTDALTAPLTAYYPASVVAGDKTLEWPAIQANVKNIANVPMTAVSSTETEDVNFAFKHLGAVLQLVLTAKDGEINVKQIDISADQNLSGEFTVQEGVAVMPAKQAETPAATISSGDISSQNIKLTAKATYLNFAVPAGTFTNYSITVTGTDGNTYSLSSGEIAIQRAMVNKLTFALNAGDLFVDGHKVTVALAEDVIANEFLTGMYVNGNNVMIEVFSKFGKGPSCTISGEAACDKTVTDNFYTFTISDITSDVTAKIGYQLVESISLNKTSISPAQEWVANVSATISPSDAVNKKVTWSSDHSDIATVDENGNITAVAQGEATITASATDGSGISATCKVKVAPPIAGSLTHEFSVSAGKKVHFSKGNLWAEDSNTLHFESNQWDSNSKYELTHVSHFTWSGDLRDAVSMNSIGDDLFCDEYKKQSVDGSPRSYYALSTAEWQYLFSFSSYQNDIRRDKYRCPVSVCGISNCVVLLPDNWTWDSATVGTGWQNEYSETTAVKWSAMEKAGAVCLPSAGLHIRGESEVRRFGSAGSYWSSTAYDDTNAYYMGFKGSPVYNFFPNEHTSRSDGACIRLIIECQ